MKSTSNPYRLARTVVPSAYRIYLTPDLDAATFAGRVEIDVDVTEPAASITLNSKELELGAATVSRAGTSHRSADPTYDLEFETASFTFDRPLPRGPATVEIAFTGILNDLLAGFYRSTFTDSGGVKHTIATTQFENTDARQAFPCWDEPAFKATFQVNLTAPSHLATFSNSRLVSDTDLGNGQRTVSFAPTMKMSTYLVAFVIGPFGATESIDVMGTPLRVVYPIGKGHLTEFALGASKFALEFFTDYFGIPYPGDKLDMIAIPDFAQGAMENLGCITYREADLLIDPNSASIGEMKRIAKVVGHEVAHMWFGDLVTMEWWQGIWLNEAFATFMELLCTDAFHPEWRAWVTFGPERDLASDIDGLHSTRPIEYEVISPEDMRGMFDRITYEKGAAVLRMLEQYLGAEVFRDGVRHYLKRHSYANTVTTDLWDALEESSGQPVRRLMGTWIHQGGHPIVTLANGTLTQRPFAFGPPRGESAIGSSWVVPVFTRPLDGGPASRHLLEESPIPVADSLPVVVNAGGSGFYRSNYGAPERAALSPRIAQLTDLERSTLLSDSWALLLSGQTTWDEFFRTAEGLGDQDEPTPWFNVSIAAHMVHRALSGRDRSGLAAQARALFAPQFERLGWDAQDGEADLAPQLRSIVLGVLGTVCQDEGIQAEAARRFESNDLDGNLATTILQIVADQNRPGDYEEFLTRFRNPKTPQDEQRYLRSLGGFPDEGHALDAAERCFSEFRTGESSMILGILSRNATTGPAVWRYFTSRWDEMLSRFTPNTLSLSAIGVPTFIHDADFAGQVEAFHQTHSVGGEQRTVMQYVERMWVGVTFADAMRQQF